MSARALLLFQCKEAGGSSKGSKRAQGRVGIALAKLSASPISASRFGTKLEIHHGVVSFQSNTGVWPLLKYPKSQIAKPAA